MLLVLENSTHDTSNDVVQLFGPRLHWLLAKVTLCSSRHYCGVPRC